MCSRTLDHLLLPRRCQSLGGWALCKDHLGQHPQLSLHGGSCHLVAPSPWCLWVALYRACCTQQGEHPPWESEAEQAARQAFCSSCPTEALSGLFLGAALLDPPELHHLCPYRGNGFAVLARGRGCLQQAVWFGLPCPWSASLPGAAGGVFPEQEMAVRLPSREQDGFAPSKRKRCEACGPPAAGLPFWRVLQSPAQLLSCFPYCSKLTDADGVNQLCIYTVIAQGLLSKCHLQ